MGLIILIMKLTDALANNNDPSLGTAVNTANNRITVTSVLRGGAAWIAGINTDDQIVSVNGNAVASLQDIVAGKKPGDKITVSISRDGQPLTLTVTLLKNQQVKYKIEALDNASPQQIIVRNKWLKL
jgi:predicted metalloprotease with PDZ domain